MDRFVDILFPKLSIDERLFAKAPVETLRAFVKLLQNRLMRLEMIVIGANIAPHLPYDLIPGVGS